MNEYRCPTCKKIYRGILRYCPYCGTRITYGELDSIAIDNYTDGKSGSVMEKVGYFGAMLQSCGCILLSLWLIAFIIFIIVMIII